MIKLFTNFIEINPILGLMIPFAHYLTVKYFLDLINFKRNETNVKTNY